MNAFHNLFTSRLLTLSDWENFKSEFERAHPEFYSNLHQVSPGLSPAEIRLATMLKLNYDTKKMAEVLCVNQKSITKSRYRLKKKLAIVKPHSLEKWIKNIG